MATSSSYRIDLGTVGALKRTLVLVLGGLAMLGAGTPDAYAVMVRQFVQDAEWRGAVCNDDTPAAYFIQPGWGPGANRWIVHLEGAGGSLEKLELRWVTARRLMSTASIDLLVPDAGIFSQSESWPGPCAASREGALGHGKHPLEALHPLDRSPGAAEHMDVRERPTHGGGRYIGIDVPGTPRPDALAVFEVRGEHAMKAGGAGARLSNPFTV